MSDNSSTDALTDEQARAAYDRGIQRAEALARPLLAANVPRSVWPIMLHHLPSDYYDPAVEPFAIRHFLGDVSYKACDERWAELRSEQPVLGEWTPQTRRPS